MLLTVSEETLCIWMYNDCYLRFSSQNFTLENLHESIHLTNNSVQKNYTSKPDRDKNLPYSNMWSLHQFQSYLNEQHTVAANVWGRKIFPGFRDNLISLVLGSLDATEFVKNNF